MATYADKINEKAAREGDIVRWLIAVAVSLGALLEVIDISITNVALPHIQGNLGATLSEVGWVITGYSMANAIIIPLTAWLGDVFGRKGYFNFSMVGFVLSSILCGMATSLPMLVIARIIQGLCGGGLLAKAQAILFEAFPKEKQGLAQGLFGICVIVGPIMGPTLGGYLTDTLDWRWIFFINIPFGIAAVIMCMICLPDDGEKKVSKVDWLGITFMTLAFGSLQYVLEKGQEDDWFSSPVILGLSILAGVSFILFLAQELTCRDPAVDLRVLRHKSVAAGTTYSLILGCGLFGLSFVVPNFAQTIMAYTAMQAGMLQLPGSIASGVMMPIMGALSGKFDSRIMVGVGAIMTALVMFSLGNLSPSTGYDDFFWPLIFRGIATVFMYMPLTMATLGSCPPQDISAASAFFSLSRQMGGSIGIAGLTTMLARREDFHRNVLIEKVNPFNAAVQDRFQALAGMFQSHGSSPHDAMNGALRLLDSTVSVQSLIMSYADLYWMLGTMFLITLPLLFFLDKGRRSKLAASAH